MIDKSGEYWHFCFDETCSPNPTSIRETVQRMFDEMAEMGDCWFMRAKPSIEIVDDFEGDSETRVYCRFSAKPTHSYEGNKLVAVGLTQLTDVDREKRRLIDFYRSTLESIASLKGGSMSVIAEQALMIERIPGEKTSAMADNEITELKRELINANALLAQRNIVIGEVGQEIEKLKARVSELEREVESAHWSGIEAAERG